MNITYKEWMDLLNLTPDHQNELQLQAMRDWCFEHVSKDNDERSYEGYLDLAANYLDVFLPNMPEHHLLDTVPAFNHMTGLQYAAERGYDRFIQSLDEPTSAALNYKTQAGMTPLHLAATHGHLHAVKALLSLGASTRELSNDQELPIQCSLFTPMLIDPDFKNRKTTIFNLLKSHDPDTINGMDTRGDTVAHAMAAHGYDALLADLIREQQPMILTHNKFTQYPIFQAILNGQESIVKLLLAVKGVIDLADLEGRVALHYAAMHGTPEMIQACCTYYPNINIRDYEDKTPLMRAEEYENEAAVKALIERGADTTPLSGKPRI